MDMNIDNRFLLHALHDALAQWGAADFRKQGDNIDSHSEENVERPTPNVQY
jgi:hypothetical protein